jgi:hypothetical protein
MESLARKILDLGSESAECRIQHWPYVDFDAKPVLTIDQVIKSTNKAMAEMKGK